MVTSDLSCQLVKNAASFESIGDTPVTPPIQSRCCILSTPINACSHLINAMYVAELVKVREELVQHPHDILWVGFLGKRREADNVHEEDADILRGR